MTAIFFNPIQSLLLLTNNLNTPTRATWTHHVAFDQNKTPTSISQTISHPSPAKQKFLQINTQTVPTKVLTTNWINDLQNLQGGPPEKQLKVGPLYNSTCRGPELTSNS